MKIYLLFFLFFWGVFSLPKENADKWRAGFTALAAPSWQIVNRCKGKSLDSSLSLQMENEALRNQVKRLCELIFFSKRTQGLNEQADQLQKQRLEPDVAHRLQYLVEVIEKQMQALPARVVFRESSSWSSSLWLSVGNKDNRALNGKIVAKNSPVLLGGVLVGVVEQVEENRCRVRLITDGTLNPSVCAVRGSEQNRIIAQQIDSLIEHLLLQNELSISTPLITQLTTARNQLDFDGATSYVARGTLQGASYSKWRSRSLTLRGVGFHSRFPIEKEQKRQGSVSGMREASMPLIQVGDLLVTTGLDGVFPAHLPIAAVSAILPLREGGCTYEIEALSLLADFDELTDLFVLPPN